MELRITIPIPRAASNPNARSHRKAVASARRSERADAKLASFAMLNELHINPPNWELVRIDIEYHNNGANAHKLDDGNLIAWLKGSEDGLQDAGIIKNDRGVKWGSITHFIGSESKERKIVLIVTPLGN